MGIIGTLNGIMGLNHGTEIQPWDESQYYVINCTIFIWSCGQREEKNKCF